MYFSNGLLSVDNYNWRAKLDKLKTVLNLWSSRDLSFVGRALILNVLGASRFWHVAKILPPPLVGWWIAIKALSGLLYGRERWNVSEEIVVVRLFPAVV